MSTRYASRIDILDTAKSLVCGDRNATNGEPNQDFTRTAGILNALGFRKAGQPIMDFDVAILVMAVKLSRIQQSPSHKDHWVDIAGYAACAWHCLNSKQVKVKKQNIMAWDK